ncbi:MAG: TlpA family protein disulfide reductase [Cyclobacteriaceae bacterium]
MKTIGILLAFLSACSSGSLEHIKYQPFSTSVIKITFDFVPADTVYLEAVTVNNIPEQGRRSEVIPVSKKGSYFLTLTNDRPASATFALDDQEYNVIILPDDTVDMSVRAPAGNLDINFNGKWAEVNEYYKAKRNGLGYADLSVPFNRQLPSLTSYQKISSVIDSLVNSEYKFLEGYVEKQKLPAWFIQYEEAEIRYLGLGFKTFLPRYIAMSNFSEKDPPDQYFDFVKKDDINNPSATASSHYFPFLTEYFLRNLSSAEYNELMSGPEGIDKIHSHILQQSKSELTGRVKELYHRYLFSSAIRFSDTTLIDSIASVYGVQDYEMFREIAGTGVTKNLTSYNLAKGDTIPDFDTTDPLDSIVSIREYQDKVLYINLWATWCEPCIKNIPELNKMIDSYRGNEDLAFLNVCINSEKEKWLTTIDRYSVKGVNLLAERNGNEKIQSIFDIQVIPTYILVNKGNILYANHTEKAPTIKSTIDELLNEMPHNKVQ